MQHKRILHIDSSIRQEESISRKLSKQLVNQLKDKLSISSVVEKNLAEGLTFIDEQWISANFTQQQDRTTDQEKTLETSDLLVNELEDADIIVIGAPIYNFTIPATLKTWIDKIARVGKTFKYTESGPVGLLQNKQAYIVISSGGTEIGSSYDFSSDYLKHIMGFIGISDVKIIDASKYDLLNPDTIKGLIA